MTMISILLLALVARLLRRPMRRLRVREVRFHLRPDGGFNISTL